MSSQEISRRYFLKTLVFGAASVVLESCKQFESLSMPTPIKTPIPTGTTTEPPILKNRLVINTETQKLASEAFDQGYLELKSRYLLDAGDGALRVLYDPEKNDSAAEVNAYGMLFAVYSGDKETFDGLWRYTERYTNSRGLPSWLTDSRGRVVDENSVFDCNEDIAFALLIADDRQWGGYRDVADKLIKNMFIHNIEEGTFIPKGGDVWGGSELTNPSYYDPYHYDTFSQFDPRWKNVSEACRTVMNKVNLKIQSGEIKYYSDWVDANGNPVSDPGNAPPSIGYDVTRIPLRQFKAAVLLSDETEQQHALQQVEIANNFFEPIITGNRTNGPFDIDALKDGYTLKGIPTGQWPRTAFASAAAVAAMVSKNEAYTRYMFEQLIGLPTDYTFNAYIRLLALLTLSGRIQ